MKFIPRQWLLAIASLLFLPVGIYVPRGLAPLFVLTAILLILGILINRTTLKLTSRHIYFAAMALPIYGALTAIWSLTPEVSIKTSIILGGTLFFGFLIVNNTDLNASYRAFPFEKYLILGGIIGFFLLLIENATNAGLISSFYEIFGLDQRRLSYHRTFIFNPALSVAALYIWPLGIILFRRYTKPKAIFITCLCSLGIFIGTSTASVVAILSGLLIMLMTRAAPQFGPKVLILATAFYIMLAPVIPSFLPNPFDPRSSLSQFYALSHIHRFMIWNTTVNHIKEKPIIVPASLELNVKPVAVLTPVTLKTSGLSTISN